MNRIRNASVLLALLIGELSAIVLLHQLGNRDGFQVPFSNLADWFQNSTFEELMGGSLRLLTLAVAYWLLASTLLYILASLTHQASAIRVAGMFTLPALRRTIDRALLVSVATTTMLGGGSRIAMAQTTTAPTTTNDPIVNLVPGLTTTTAAPTETVSTPGVNSTTTEATTTTTTTEPDLPIPDEDDAETTVIENLVPDVAQEASSTTSSSTTSTTAAPGTTDTVKTPGVGGAQIEIPTIPTTAAPTTAAPTTAPPTSQPTTPDPATPQVLGEQQHLVVPGDNLWDIAEAQLSAGGATPSEAQVRDYWLKVIEVNRDNLRSGDPNLIYPGEVVELPAV